MNIEVEADFGARHFMVLFDPEGAVLKIAVKVTPARRAAYWRELKGSAYPWNEVAVAAREVWQDRRREIARWARGDP